MLLSRTIDLMTQILHTAPMAWLKTLALDGTQTRTELPATGAIPLESRRRKPNPGEFPQPKSAPNLHGVEGAWYADGLAGVMSGAFSSSPDAPRPTHSRLEHGAAIGAGGRAYVYLDRIEHRDGALEAAACASPAALEPWVRWLEEKGDPYAGPLRRMLGGHEFGPSRERWWLEGIDRGVASIGATFTMRDGFLREADLLHGKLELDLLILHLLGLRVARGLERLNVAVPRFLAAATWKAFGAADYWKQLRWPSTFRHLHLDCGGRSREATALRDGVARSIPNVEVSC